MVMQNEKQAMGAGVKKNGPTTSGPERETQTLTERDVGTVVLAKPDRKAKSVPREDLLKLFEQYEALDAEYQKAVLALLAVKVRRSKVVEEIYFSSPDKKSFKMKDKGGVIWTIMTREDKKEGSPTKGQRFYFFRRPSTFDPLEI